MPEIEGGFKQLTTTGFAHHYIPQGKLPLMFMWHQQNICITASL